MLSNVTIEEIQRYTGQGPSADLVEALVSFTGPASYNNTDGLAIDPTLDFGWESIVAWLPVITVGGSTPRKADYVAASGAAILQQQASVTISSVDYNLWKDEANAADLHTITYQARVTARLKNTSYRPS